MLSIWLIKPSYYRVLSSLLLDWLQYFSDSFNIMVGSNSLSNPSDVYQLSDIVIVSLKYIDSFLFNFRNTQHF